MENRIIRIEYYKEGVPEKGTFYYVEFSPGEIDKLFQDLDIPLNRLTKATLEEVARLPLFERFKNMIYPEFYNQGTFMLGYVPDSPPEETQSLPREIPQTSSQIIPLSKIRIFPEDHYHTSPNPSPREIPQTPSPMVPLSEIQIIPESRIQKFFSSLKK